MCIEREFRKTIDNKNKEREVRMKQTEKTRQKKQLDEKGCSLWSVKEGKCWTKTKRKKERET